MTGINRGEGLYFNYAFLILWLVDVAVLWTVASKVPSRLRRSTDLACVFMVFNATVVFGPRWWIGLMIAFGVIVTWLRQEKPGSADAADSTSLE